MIKHTLLIVVVLFMVLVVLAPVAQYVQDSMAAMP